MNLSKALKLKNKLVNKLEQETHKLLDNNSKKVNSTNYVDASKQYPIVLDKLRELAKFKATLHTASEPIREKIFLLSELKSFVNRFKHLDTKEGVVDEVSGYNMTREERSFKADISEPTKEKYLEQLEAEIERIQDKIDSFNAITKFI